MDSHCPQCAGYEAAVMARVASEPLEAGVEPCKAYQMSAGFRDWAVGRMQREVGAQISGAGLDRMAVLKRPSGQVSDDKEKGKRAP